MPQNTAGAESGNLQASNRSRLLLWPGVGDSSGLRYVVAMHARTKHSRDGWIDISHTLIPGISVWPGDPEFTSGHSSSISGGDVCNVGRMSLGLHTGTHAESPLHFEQNGPDISEIPLEVFIGPALVVSATGPIIDLAFVRTLDVPERLLLKTGSGIERGWHGDFAGLDAEAAEELVRRGVRLLGIDTPSVDRAQDETWPVHRVFARTGVVVLENLLLADISPGTYELVALPLNLPGLEASPVRAAIRPLSGK